MNLFRSGFIFLSALLFLAVAPVQAAETVLKYSATETRVPVPKPGKISKKGKETHLASKKTVVLGVGFFSVKEKKVERIYDFKNRRIYYLDHQAKTQAEISMFADPAFRAREFQHRLEMNALVEKSGGAALDDPFTMESIFGIETEERKFVLTEETEKKDKIRFLKDKQMVSEVLFSENSFEEKSVFNQFLIYDHSIHPQIRRKIRETRKIPSVIRLRLESVDGIDHVVLILDSVKTQEDQGFKIPSNYTLLKKKPGTVPAAEPLGDLLQSSQKEKGKKAYHDRDWFEKEILKAQGKKNFLDNALLVLEYGLQSGDQAWATQAMAKLAEHQKEDTELDRFFRSLGIAGKNQAGRSLGELQKINRKKLTRGHVIDIIMANQHSVLGQNEKAEKKMLAALKANPFIAGAYKDLGDMFYADFDMVSAWMCWDFGRKQAPDHFMLKPISEYESELLRDLPEFFNS